MDGEREGSEIERESVHSSPADQEVQCTCVYVCVYNLKFAHQSQSISECGIKC